MLLVFMFSAMAIWYWLTIAVLFPGEDYFFHFQEFLVACAPLCRLSLTIFGLFAVMSNLSLLSVEFLIIFYANFIDIIPQNDICMSILHLAILLKEFIRFINVLAESKGFFLSIELQYLHIGTT